MKLGNFWKMQKNQKNRKKRRIRTNSSRKSGTKLKISKTAASS
jgi:hypothetical protein